MEFQKNDSHFLGRKQPQLAQTEFYNSVLRMGRNLLAAAKAIPVPIPHILWFGSQLELDHVKSRSF